jgi:Zn-dependent M16 (insulinase) family peptidase
MTGLSNLTTLNTNLSAEENLRQLATQLEEIHQLFIKQPRQYLVVAESEQLQQFKPVIAATFASNNHQLPADNLIDFSPRLQSINHSWTTNTQVSFCARAFPTVASSHPDAPALTVLGGVLRNGYLHRAIREQGGAYGGGASQDNQSGAFKFFSYRDPRITETLADFDRSVDWLLSQPLDREQIDEAILGVVSSLDKPGSPAGEAIQAFHGELNGRSEQSHREFRRQVLEVGESDLKRVALAYLNPERAQTTVITNADLAADLPLEIKGI